MPDLFCDPVPPTLAHVSSAPLLGWPSFWLVKCWGLQFDDYDPAGLLISVFLLAVGSGGRD